ncbi:anaerobic sulfite reductase subunit AsrB [Clostridium sp. Marseille-Q2269]|uniref:anaerobic sulfite reductase subunit AsrB n=1 Tax=Clostridium sp. Marseille-Q2269 TaxID=2942205 RepID=UPI0020744F93|nr:anaerobic sulfite reductase subunit AsrB [Clostridium sp. Marseille-Q2269]
MNANNVYMPFKSEILDIKKHTDIEYTFRMSYIGEVKPGQFFEVSLPKYGEAPISVCEIGEGYVDLTIRRVGVVTDEIYNYNIGQNLFLRGPYGNGFNLDNYKNKEIVVVAGGTGLAPVKGIMDYFSKNSKECKDFNLIVGFKTINNILFKEDIEKWKENINVTVTLDVADEGYEGNTGLVTKYIPQLDIKDKENVQVIVVGPPIMMKFAVVEFLKLGIKEENIWISQERKMCCGLGKCGHCKIDDTYICLEGPVFNYVKGKTLID